MPKLLAFLPCDKVIIANDNTTSLITLLEQMRVTIPPEERAKVPPDAEVFRSWHIFTLWQRLPEDEGKKFEQRFLLVLPSGKETTSAVQPIEFDQGIEHFRNIINIVGFPIGSTGFCRLKLFLRELGESNVWAEVAEYPLNVFYA